VRLQSLYRCTFASTERWSVKLDGAGGTERQGFLLVEGRANGRLSGRLRAANSPRQRTDGTQTPDFRGVIVTHDGAAVYFAWHGYGRAAGGGPSQLLGSITHLSEDARYSWLNQAICVLTGEVRPQADDRFEVVLEVSELIWEPIPGPEE
jgi:hypothetical protein